MAAKRKKVSTELPFDGEFFFSRTKRFEELIFFVHFYEGSKRQILRHIKMVNELGFDAFAFNLKGDLNELKKFNLPVSPTGKFGLKHAYADQIEKLLNEIDGKKIMYTFSNPSAAAMEAMARRQCSDTVAMICDSGPTARFMPSAFQLFEQEYKVESRIARLALTPVLSLLWSPHLHKDIQDDLATFPKGFRVLSIRGWKDKLIPPAHIDEVFDGHKQLHWQKLGLPEAEHLTGLRDYKDDYVPAVKKFLTSVATALS
jgi:hypothetical protein